MLSSEPPNVTGALETARRTIRDAKRATDIIARLRAFFAKRETAIEPLDLNEVSREVIALSQRSLQDGGITVQLEFDDRIPSVEADGIRFSRLY